MNNFSSDYSNSSDNEELSNESIKSLTTGLPNEYRRESIINIPSSDDEEIVTIMNNNDEIELENLDKGISKSIPQDEISNSSDKVTDSILGESTNLNECVICLGGPEDGILIKNSLCNCKFVYHSDCYYEWLYKSRKNTCILCKKPIIDSNIFITNRRLINILENKYIDRNSNIVEHPLDIIEITENNRVTECLKDFVYNFKIEYLKYIMIFIISAFLTTVAILIGLTIF
tara:strand:- start:36 stop:725 length:690 start_codon:yes stop_codon:yes gene_type:complete